MYAAFATVFDALYVTAHIAGLAVGVVLCVYDWREHRLPNRHVALLLAFAAVAGVIEITANGSAHHIADIAAGAAIFGGPGLVLHLIAPHLMGFGDVKLGLVLGLWIGCHNPWSALAALLLAYLLALPESLWRLLRYGRGPRRGEQGPLHATDPRGLDPISAAPASGDKPVSNGPVINKATIAFGPYLIAATVVTVAGSFRLPHMS